MLATCSFINDVKASVPSEPHQANAIWIEPSSVTIDIATMNLGYKFNATVWVNVTQKSFVWQVKLYFNSTFFNATRIGYTNGDKSDFFVDYSPMPLTPKINNAEGYILHGETLLGSDERDTGYGSLMWVEFKLTKIPTLNHFTLDFSMPYGIDTFVLTPYFDTLPMETVEGTDMPIIPEFPHSSIMLLVAIVTFTASTILARRLKNYG